MTSGIITPGALNLAVNPLAHKPGDMIRAVNIESDQIGAKKKRPGYTTHLTSLASPVTSLFNWVRNDGTTFWNYALAGGTLFYSTQGTGDWTVCGNGTLTSGARVGYADTQGTSLIIGDGVTATRHTSDGTSFTNTSGAPVATDFVPYQGRMYALGTIALHYSTTGTPTDWISDSTSIDLPGGGAPKTAFKVADRIIATKTTGNMYRWDGFNLVDISTELGPTSPQSLAKIEDYVFYLNRLGQFGYNGDKPQIVSNPIEKIIYNDAGEGIVGTVFDNAPAVTHKYEYLTSVETVTDDLTDETISNAVTVYDYQIEEWWINSFAHRPTAWLSYRDASGNQQLIFGDTTGQCYTYGGTATSDNGSPIETVMEGFIHMNTLLDKKWSYFRASFNPGCEAQIQIAISNTFTRAKKNWITLGQALDGVVEYHFPESSRGPFLFWKITESSRSARMHFYGFEYDADIIKV